MGEIRDLIYSEMECSLSKWDEGGMLTLGNCRRRRQKPCLGLDVGGVSTKGRIAMSAHKALV